MPQTLATLDVEVRTGARLEPILRAFELLRTALESHGHRYTAEESAALLAAARVLEGAVAVEPA